jgi:hypothetical protein
MKKIKTSTPIRILAFTAGFVLFSVLMLAQQPSAGPSAAGPAKQGSQSGQSAPASQSSPAAAPLIPDSDRADFFERQLEFLQAQQAMQAAQQAMQAAVEKLTRDCGEKFLPQIGPDKKLVCAAKAKVGAEKPAAGPAKK